MTLTLDTVADIGEVGTSLLRELLRHDEAGDNRIEEILIEGAQIIARGYKEHTGEFLDPSLIHPEAPID